MRMMLSIDAECRVLVLVLVSVLLVPCWGTHPALSIRASLLGHNRNERSDLLVPRQSKRRIGAGGMMRWNGDMVGVVECGVERSKPRWTLLLSMGRQ